MLKCSALFYFSVLISANNQDNTLNERGTIPLSVLPNPSLAYIRLKRAEPTQNNEDENGTRDYDDYEVTEDVPENLAVGQANETETALVGEIVLPAKAEMVKGDTSSEIEEKEDKAEMTKKKKYAKPQTPTSPEKIDEMIDLMNNLNKQFG